MSKKTSPTKIANAERVAECMQLRKAGATYPLIAAKLGCTPQNVFKIISRQMARTAAELSDTTEHVRLLELERLDALLMGQWKQATSGHQGAVAAVLRIMERRAKILGLDMPTKTALTNPEGTEAAPFLIALPEGWGSAGDATGASAGADTDGVDHTGA